VDIPRRRLGTSGIEITSVGFGAWAAGGGGWSFGWGPQDDEQSIAAILHCVDLGVSWVDTAAIYGLGHSEEVVARALARLPRSERPLVFTKCGLLFDRERPFDNPSNCLEPASIRRECEASLQRLGVDCVDLYQCHWPDPSTPVEESWGAMARLQDEGKVRAIGVSNFDPSLLERCEAIRHVDSLQPPFSMIRRWAGDTVLPWCDAHGTGVIVYSPMQAGLLTDAFSADRVERFPADDWRRTSDDFAPPHLARNLALRDALKPLAARRGVSVAALAVAWTLAWPGVTGAIVGARSPQQVDGWVAAGALLLDRDEFEEVAAAIARTGAGSGAVKP
jgi:aryl-alcohol dehydrogenase-like predicted oxidoreductase